VIGDSHIMVYRENMEPGNRLEFAQNDGEVIKSSFSARCGKSFFGNRSSEGVCGIYGGVLVHRAKNPVILSCWIASGEI